MEKLFHLSMWLTQAYHINIQLSRKQMWFTDLFFVTLCFALLLKSIIFLLVSYSSNCSKLILCYPVINFYQLNTWCYQNPFELFSGWSLIQQIMLSTLDNRDLVIICFFTVILMLQPVKPLLLTKLNPFK